jgi:hypothetical protein
VEAIVLGEKDLGLTSSAQKFEQPVGADPADLRARSVRRGDGGSRRRFFESLISRGHKLDVVRKESLVFREGSHLAPLQVLEVEAQEHFENPDFVHRGPRLIGALPPAYDMALWPNRARGVFRIGASLGEPVGF